MSADATPARSMAQLLWTHAQRRVPAPAPADVTAEQLLTTLEHGLRRWIGAEGYAALLSRAVLLTVPAHPALARVRDLAVSPDARADGAAAAPFSDAELHEAMLGLLVVMTDLLAHVIGPEMAMRLMELSGSPASG